MVCDSLKRSASDRAAMPVPPARDSLTVDKSDDRVKRMFAGIARKYDLMNHLLSFQVDRYWRWYVVDQVRPVGAARILDVCTGTGDLALAFHKRFGSQCQITATDFCPEMLEIARKKSQHRESSRITWLEADTQDLPFESNSFQIVCVAFGIRNVSDTLLGLREMHRVCEPGGRVAILEFSAPRRPPFSWVYTFYFRHILPSLGQWLARNNDEAYKYLPQSVAEFPSGEAFAEWMRSVGLQNVRMTPLTCGIATLYVGWKAP